jgi:hypothetical protein
MCVCVCVCVNVRTDAPMYNLTHLVQVDTTATHGLWRHMTQVRVPPLRGPLHTLAGPCTHTAARGVNTSLPWRQTGDAWVCVYVCLCVPLCCVLGSQCTQSYPDQRWVLADMGDTRCIQEQ